MHYFQYSEAGLALTKRFEGLRLEAYQDSSGVWTIGYGHTGTEVVCGRRISEVQAEILLRSDLAAAEACVNHAVTSEINQQQFDALVDFAFNVGRGHFLGSSLLQALNAGNFVQAASSFSKWVDAGGRSIPGLMRRRAAEAELFLEAA